MFYATDRERDGSSRLLSGSARQPKGAVRFGQVRVQIPILNHKSGDIERPPRWWVFSRENPDRHFIVIGVVEQRASQFYSDLRNVVGRSPAKQAFVFIHGFNTLFHEAILRTAQLSYDLGFEGAPIAYSWPSDAVNFRGPIPVERLESLIATLRYPADEANNDWTVPHLRRFLERLQSESGAATIHLIAHSMGNRALLNALNQMTVRTPVRFNQLVLAAPDIDAGVFRELAGKLKSLVARATLYASSGDWAIWASQLVHSNPRAGATLPALTVLSGIDTIDASAVNTSLSGHDYYHENRSVLDDVHYVLDGLEPGRRARLRRQQSFDGEYWVFQP